jgi:hypothetical protein
MPVDAPNSKGGISIPEGTLRMASFYWYERDAELLEGEKLAMKKFFPNFQFGKLSNGKLYWYGTLSPGLFKDNTPWDIQAVYQHNHPDNSSENNNYFGGSVRIYSLDPNLDNFENSYGRLPHTLHDEEGHVYLCTAGDKDVKTGQVVTSAASSISWAVKWISGFEMWVAGELPDFPQHVL